MTNARRPKVSPAVRLLKAPLPTQQFDEVLALIEAARARAYQAVNTELVGLYWQLGEYISGKIASAEWGDGVVDELAAAIAREYPGMRGYTRRNLFRMRQFYEAYRGRRESVTAGDTIAVDPSPHHPEPGEAARGARVLHARRDQGAVDEARARTPDPVGRDLRGEPGGEESVTSGDTNSPDRPRRVQERLQPRVPRRCPTTTPKRTSTARCCGTSGASSPSSAATSASSAPSTRCRSATRTSRSTSSSSTARSQCLVAFELKVDKFKPADLGQAQLLRRGARPRREEAARAALDRRAAVRDQGRRGRRVRARAHHLADARRRVPDDAAAKGAAPRKLHELYAQLAPEEPDVGRSS